MSGKAGAHPRDVAVMIGAKHIDEPREAALALGEMVGDVGGEVGLVAVLTHHHPILLIAEGGGPEPERTFPPVQVPGALEHRERVIDGAALGELALGGPLIEAHPELGKIVADVGEHFCE